MYIFVQSQAHSLSFNPAYKKPQITDKRFKQTTEPTISQPDKEGCSKVKGLKCGFKISVCRWVTLIKRQETRALLQEPVHVRLSVNYTLEIIKDPLAFTPKFGSIFFPSIKERKTKRNVGLPPKQKHQDYFKLLLLFFKVGIFLLNYELFTHTAKSFGVSSVTKW